MGWASATELFDGAVDVALEVLQGALPTDHVPSILVRAVVEKMYRQVDWDDWDTQDESKYFTTHLAHIMYDMGEIDEEYWNEFI